MEEEAWRRMHGGSMMEEESWEALRRKHSGGSMEEAWRRKHGGGCMEEKHPGGIQEAPRRHPGGTQEASRRHPGGTQGPQETPEQF